MIFIRENKFNDIVEEIRQMEKEGYVEITKDDCISFKAKIAKRLRCRFSIQLEGIIITGREISIGNYYKNIKRDEIGCLYADKMEYTHLSLDRTSLTLATEDFNHGLQLNWDNDMSFELAE